MILGQHFSAFTAQQDEKGGPWDSALETALSAARTRQCEDSYKALKQLLVPFLERPQALATLMDLAARWDPEGRAVLRQLMRKWAESTLALLRNEGANCRGPQVVSRTLADLFYRQGHKEEAKRLYRSLLERNPRDQATLKEYQERFSGGELFCGDGQLLRALEEMVRRIRMAKTGRKTGEETP